MRAIIFNTEAQALARDKQEANSRCFENTTTLEWWGIKEGTNGQWALLIGDDVVTDEVAEVTEDWFI